MSTYSDLAKDYNNTITTFIVLEAINRDTLLSEKIYLSDKYFYISNSIKFGNNINFEYLIKDIPNFEREFDPLENNVIITSSYTISFNNVDNFFDKLDLNYILKNQNIDIYSYVDNLNIEDSLQLASGYIESLSINNLQATLKIKDRIIYEKNVELNKFTDADGLVTEDQKDELKQEVFGKINNLEVKNVSYKDGYYKPFRPGINNLQVKFIEQSHEFYGRKYYRVEILNGDKDIFKRTIGINNTFSLESETFLLDSTKYKLKDCRFKYCNASDLFANFADETETPPAYNQGAFDLWKAYSSQFILVYIENTDEISTFPQSVPLNTTYSITLDSNDNELVNNLYLISDNKASDKFNLELEGFVGNSFFTNTSIFDYSFLEEDDEIIVTTQVQIPNLNQYDKLTFRVDYYDSLSKRIHLKHRLPVNITTNLIPTVYTIAYVKYVSKINMFDTEFDNRLLESNILPLFKETDMNSLAPGPSAPDTSTMPYMTIHDDSFYNSTPVHIGFYYEATDSGLTYNKPAGLVGDWYTIQLTFNNYRRYSDSVRTNILMDKIYNLINSLPIRTENYPFQIMRSKDNSFLTLKKTSNSSMPGYIPSFTTLVVVGSVTNAFRNWKYHNYQTTGLNTQITDQDHLMFDTIINNNNLLLKLDRRLLNIDNKARVANDITFGSEQFQSDMLIPTLDFTPTYTRDYKKLVYVTTNYVIPGAAPKRRSTLSFSEGDLIYIEGYNNYNPFKIEYIENDNEIYCVEDTYLGRPKPVNPFFPLPNPNFRIRTQQEISPPSEIYVNLKTTNCSVDSLIAQFLTKFSLYSGLDPIYQDLIDLKVLLGNSKSFVKLNENKKMYNYLNEILESYNLVSYLDESGYIRIKFNQTLNLVADKFINESDLITYKYEKEDFQFTEVIQEYNYTDKDQRTQSISSTSLFLDSISASLNFNDKKIIESNLSTYDFNTISSLSFEEHLSDKFFKDTIKLQVFSKAELLEFRLNDIVKLVGFNNLYQNIVFRVIKVKTDGNNVELTLFGTKPDFISSFIVDEEVNNVSDGVSLIIS